MIDHAGTDVVDVLDRPLNEFSADALAGMAKRNLAGHGYALGSDLDRFYNRLDEWVQTEAWRKIADSWDEFLVNWVRIKPIARKRLIDLQEVIEHGSKVTHDKHERDEKIRADYEAGGKTQQAIGDEVGLSQRRVGQIIEEKGAIAPKTSNQAEEAKKAKRSIRSQKALDAIRKVDTALAESADRGDIPINTAMRQAGLIDQSKIAIRELRKCNEGELRRVLEWLSLRP